MGLVDNVIQGLARGAARKPLTSKQGNKNFYKGNRSGRMGSWTRRGHYVIEQWRKRQFVAPDLEDFKLQPYVSPKADDRFKNSHTVVDYFQLENSDLKDNLNEACYSRAMNIWEKMDKNAHDKYLIKNKQ
ncbi:mitochondrial ribosomal protein L27-domain-containing protein [Globomyces pollinis-pini]|nr:mitochondrial ribosomal protein L27-domain-containing protein [Globomyces pollinis-pini]KAJ2991584.1 hypothetical protein HDV02_003679 [Globomyces sp. JEL0801]